MPSHRKQRKTNYSSSSNGSCSRNKFRFVMREFYHHHLHTGSKTGRIVTNSQQAKAIAASEARRYC